jgi:type IV secretory pathway VirJ component
MIEMKNVLTVMLVLCGLTSISQTALPIKRLDAAGDKPFVFMVSGDGGFKEFTVSLAQAMRDKGYSVALMDARSYFWNKKTPEETTAAIAAYVAKSLPAEGNHKWVMIGYSFGADITPFVVNRLPDSLKSKLSDVLLLSPSTSTDFEIHLSDIFGGGKKRAMDVIQEINRMGKQPIAVFSGDKESEFPVSQIKLPAFKYELIKGDHHYNGDFKLVAARLAASIN